MRVSDAMFHDLSQRHLIELRERMSAAQEQAISGKRVRKPSDDPLAAASERRDKALENRALDHQRAIRSSSALLHLMDSALDQLADTLSRVKELAIQAASDTVSPEQRTFIATEVQRLSEALVAIGNSEAEGRFIFAGHLDDEPPFAADGSYRGDGAVRQVEVAPGVTLPVGVSAARIFGVGGGSDVFGTLRQLIDALQANDVTAIRASIDTVGTAHDQVVGGRAEVGAHMEAFDVSGAAAERVQDASVLRQQHHVGIDAVEAFMELNRARQALEAAVHIAGQLPPSLLGSGR